MIRLERRVGREIERVRHGDRGDGAGLLVAGQDNLNGAEIAARAQHFALGAIVAGENPEAIFPTVVNNVVNVADRAGGKRVRDLPGLAAIGGRIDVNFGPLTIVEVLAPINHSARDRRNVQRTRAAPNFVGDAKVIATRSSSYYRAGNCGD